MSHLVHPLSTDDSSSSPAPFDYVDLDKIAEDLICPLCHLPFVDPLVHQSCENTFCSRCIEPLSACPCCGEEGLKKACVVANKIVRNQLDKLKVHCDMCKNVVNRGELKEHQETTCPLLEAYMQVERKVLELKRKHEAFVDEERMKLQRDREDMLREVEEERQRQVLSIQQERAELEKDKQLLREERVQRIQLERSNKPIHLNVGGSVMTASLSTFMDCRTEPSNLFQKMFSGEHPLYETNTNTFQDRVFFIDCKPEVFEVVLDWLQYGVCFHDEWTEKVKFKLVQACFSFELENLAAFLREKFFQTGLPICQSQLMAIFEKKKRTGIKLCGLSMHGISFGSGEFIECQVVDCELTQVMDGNLWSKCTFIRCNFVNAKSSLLFKDCTFENCTFTKCRVEVTSCTFTDCKMNEMDMKEQDLTSVSFTNVDFIGCNLADCKMSKLTNLKLLYCNFTQANLLAGMVECVVIGGNFTKSQCDIAEGCTFTNCKMTEANLCFQDFAKDIFSNVDFTSSSIWSNKTDKIVNMELTGCNFAGSNIALSLKGCQVSKCNFSKSKCKFEDGCSFTDCKMHLMNWSFQDFTNVEFINVDFSGSAIANCKMGRVTRPIFRGCSLGAVSGLFPFSMLNEHQQVRLQEGQLGWRRAELLFKATRDGFTGQAFHAKCNGKTPTITFVRSENGFLFGGYTQAQWNSVNGYASDSTAFVFTFKNGNELEVFKVKEASKAIYNSSCSLAVFGEGSDVFLSDNCNSINSSYANLGCSYLLPTGLQYGTALTKSYLAGCEKFKVAEIETYQLFE